MIQSITSNPSSASEIESPRQALLRDLHPFFNFIRPEEQAHELQAILKGLNFEGLIRDCVKLALGHYKITLDRERDLTYTTKLGHIGHITIHRETEITLHPPEHGRSKNEPETITDQRRISFNPPISVRLGWLFKGNVESLAADCYMSQRGKGEQSRFEVRADDNLPNRISAEQIVSHLKCLNWA